MSKVDARHMYRFVSTFKIESIVHGFKVIETGPRGEQIGFDGSGLNEPV